MSVPWASVFGSDAAVASSGSTGHYGLQFCGAKHFRAMVVKLVFVCVLFVSTSLVLSEPVLAAVHCVTCTVVEHFLVLLFTVKLALHVTSGKVATP